MPTMIPGNKKARKLAWNVLPKPVNMRKKNYTKKIRDRRYRLIETNIQTRHVGGF